MRDNVILGHDKKYYCLYQCLSTLMAATVANRKDRAIVNYYIITLLAGQSVGTFGRVTKLPTVMSQQRQLINNKLDGGRW